MYYRGALVMMELVPVHQLSDCDKSEALEQCVKILNYEWPRSDTIRLRGLQSSSDKLPSNLVLFTREEERIRVIGHSRISKIPADNTQIFIESVVIHPQLRYVVNHCHVFVLMRCVAGDWVLVRF